MLIRHIVSLSMLFALVLVSACGPQERQPAKEHIAFTAVPPVAGLMERVGAGHWQANALVEQGKDPHTFSLRPRMAADLSAASLYVFCGMEMDNVVRNRPQNGLVFVDLLSEEEAGVAYKEEGHTHEVHGHGHGAMNPHLWLDPEGILHIAETLRDSYSRLDPANAVDYTAAYAALEEELASLDAEIRSLLAPYKGRRFYVQHDAFTRFAAHYGLEQVSVEEHDKSPSAARLEALSRQARKDKVRMLYAQSGHNPAPLHTLAAPLGARVEYLEPLGRDALASLRTIAETLALGYALEDQQ